MADNKEKERINSLCMKYFTPELCDSPVTESKTALKGKILTQLLKFGDSLFKKNSKQYELNHEEFCDNVVSVMSKCLEKWEKEPKDRNYSSYFAQAIHNELLRIISDKNNRTLSLKMTINSDSEDTIKVKNNSVDYQVDKLEIIFKVEKYLKAVNTWFKIRKREDWNKTIVTVELYEGLKEYFDYYPEKKINQFSFVDEAIFNLPQAPKNKELAKLLDKDEGQISRARSKFRQQIAELLKQDSEI